MLIILTSGLSVPLDSEALAALAVGIPVGLGIYLAWVHPDRSATNVNLGFAAAAGGALVGAWMGFNATEGLFALFTAIVGAAVGANLALIFLDVSGARGERRRPAPSVPVEPEPEHVGP